MSKITRRDAKTYQLAMQACPLARVHEFRLPLQMAELKAHETLLDFPSGGAYLQPFIAELAADVRYLPVENVPGYCDTHSEILTGTWADLPVADGTVDVVLNLASLHHFLDRRADFYRECARVLSKQGRLIIGDVLEGSRPARFLDEFVGQFSSQGHQARFINLTVDSLEIEAAGLLKVSDTYVRRYAWNFPDFDTLLNYCRNLFRIDLATDRQIEAGLRDYLGVQETPDGFDLQWELGLIRADKCLLG